MSYHISVQLEEFSALVRFFQHWHYFFGWLVLFFIFLKL